MIPDQLLNLVKEAPDITRAEFVAWYLVFMSPIDGWEFQHSRIGYWVSQKFTSYFLQNADAVLAFAEQQPSFKGYIHQADQLRSDIFDALAEQRRGP